MLPAAWLRERDPVSQSVLHNQRSRGRSGRPITGQDGQCRPMRAGVSPLPGVRMAGLRRRGEMTAAQPRTRGQRGSVTAITDYHTVSK